jgi:PAS domain S-box-containing protein
MKDPRPGAPELFEAFLKSAQYLVRLQTQQDIGEHLGKFVLTHFPATWLAFVQRDSGNNLALDYCTLPEPAAAQTILTDEVRSLVADVLESGFLASRILHTPSPSMTAFLPLVENYQTSRVMLIGHKDAQPLSNELLSIYLALAGLAGTTTERLHNERELLRHRTELEEQIKERTASIKTANEALQHSRHAALSLAEDALEARKAAERVNADLQQAIQALDISRMAALNLMEDAVKARKQAEQTGADLHRLNRTLKALSDSNQAMMRARDEAQYLGEVCQIIVKDCGHAMVWVGFAEHNAAQTIRPAASAGFEAGYLNTLHLTWADTERGRGPTGTAIRTGKTCHCKNMLTDPAFAPWREEALKRGYASSLVLPLLADGRAFGALTIYSTQPDPFSQDEVNLLGELVTDLTQGITALRLRADRAEAEEALRASEMRYRTLFETMSEGFCLDEIICDADGKPCDLRYLAVNPAFERQTGLKAPDVVGRTVMELFPQTEPFWIERYGKVALTGEPAHFEAWFGPLARWFAVSAFRTDPGRFAVTFTDVTERKRAEEQLRLLSTAVESADNGIAITDREGRILWVNPAFSRLTGYTHAEAVGQTPRLLKSDQHPPEFYRQIWTTLLRGEPWQGELVNRRKDGSLYTEEMTVTPVRAAGAEITHFVAIKQDVSARKRAEQRTDLLADTASRLLKTDSPQNIVNELCDQVMAFLDCQAFFNFLVDEQADKLHLNACSGVPPEDARKVEWLDYGTAVCGCAARDGCRIVAEDIPNTPDPRTELVKSFGILAYACHPLMVQDRLLGTLSFGTRTRTRFTEEDLSLMKAVADQVAIAMERQQAQAALKELNEELEERVAVRTAALHAAERYARSLLEASLDPLVTISHEGRITDVNLATELVTGVPRDRLVGSSFSSYFTEPDKADVGYQRVMAQGLVRDYPLTIRHASGHTTDVLYNATVYRNEAGEVQGVFAAARDITERKQAERRRDFTNALLALFAEKSSASDYLDSVVETIRQWTGAQALGIRLLNEQHEVPYRAWAGFEPGFLDLEHRLSLERDQCLCIRAISGALEVSDRPLLTPGGSFRSDDAIAFAQSLPAEQLAHYRGNCMKFGFSSLAIIPIRYRDQVVGALHLADRRPGQFPLALVEFIESMTPLIGEAIHRFQTEAELAKHRDHLEVLVKQRTSQLETANAQLQSEIAERRHAQEALQHSAENLQRSNRDLEQFAYVASHDLQEPLRAVGGYVRLLERRLPQNFDAKAHEWVNGAVEGASRMERLITDLLAFSRVGTRSGELFPVDLNAVLDDALHNLQNSIKTAQATIVRQPLPTLTVDATQMMQLFQNLIGNAIKFRGERPPEIRVGAEQRDGRWVFSVSDNGIGIEPQYFERIFQIFQRLHTRKQYPGTGIGLAICKRIIERHHGEIWVESRPNEGTTFFFSLPPSGTSLTPGFRSS